MFDYTYCYKQTLPVAEPWAPIVEWDIFLSTYTSAERLHRVFEAAPARRKLWIAVPEYGYTRKDLPSPDLYVSDSADEAALIRAVWAQLGSDVAGKSLCVDITGFIRPHLLFLVRWLWEQGVRRFDALYSEPDTYAKKDKTTFSGGGVEQVRQVAGYEGVHVPDTLHDVLIIGAGYDHDLIAEVAENKNEARKIQLLGLPSLRADMYQENVLRAQRAEEAAGSLADRANNVFAPANDPFVTAAKLQKIVRGIESRGPLTNLYLSPLATKPQALGFALYYLTERQGTATSIVFPFSSQYQRETTRGLTRIWRYTVELQIGPSCSTEV